MDPFRYREITHADHHIMNPLSPGKLARVIDYLRLEDGDRLIDVGCGKGSLLQAVARSHRIEAVGLELNPAFAAIARQALAEGGLAASAQIVEGPALDFQVAPGSFDVAVCIGSTFALGGLEASLDWMARAVKPGGRIAIGEPFALGKWTKEVSQRWAEYDRTLPDIAAAFETRNLAVIGLVASSTDDWDQYEGLQWLAATAWLRDHPDDPDAPWLAATIAASRADYLREERDGFGWAVFVAQTM
jgi:ubiquinone/menaquinone biosynthesis C-methylase UbiE